MMTLSALLEALGIGLVIPFVSLLGHPELVEKYRALRRVRDAFGVHTHVGMMAVVGGALVLSFVVKNVYVALVEYAQNRFIFHRQVRTQNELVERYMRRPYAFHLSHNSAELIHNVHTEVHLVYAHVIVSIFVIVVEILSVAVILCFLVFVSSLIVPVVGVVVGAASFIFYRLIHKKASRAGEEQRDVHAEMLRWLQQGLGGVKEARVLGAEDFFINAFQRRSDRFAKLLVLHRQLSTMPRYVLETSGVAALVAITLAMLARSGDPAVVLPTLGALAVASVRMLPSATRILGSVSLIRFCKPSVEALWDAMIPMAGDGKTGRRRGDVKALELTRDIELCDVSVQYAGSEKPSVHRVSMTIKKGESIAFVGASGAGKSTLVDTLIGLLDPTSGEIKVDGEPLEGERLLSWQRSIGYIPQQVFLSDDTMRRNIAFGLEDSEIDEERVLTVVRMARLHEHVKSLPEGLDTMVGERGVRLSGGQRQRIGIARALYSNPRVLVLDEATSALDGETEREIVDAMESLRSQCTMIVIAHRLSTVRGCDRLAYMDAGKLSDVGTWDELAARSPGFAHLVALSQTDKIGAGGDGVEKARAAKDAAVANGAAAEPSERATVKSEASSAQKAEAPQNESAVNAELLRDRTGLTLGVVVAVLVVVIRLWPGRPMPPPRKVVPAPSSSTALGTSSSVAPARRAP